SQLVTLRARATRVRATGSRMYNPSWHTALDVKGMVLVAETIVRSALLRRESRGAHTRVDFPETSDELQKVNTVTRNFGSEIGVDFIERPPLPDQLAEIVFERSI
ncbi:MAG: fumarate reductase/succinate dehydrogenase flavoprotein subunit, partial [Candidatus Eremiobacteraeota bacterium]|nr:fumarate reductase/succinate dehydrogenase flavoprotein subunit [Candidatus Eremiobacteraeota bacterium]